MKHNFLKSALLVVMAVCSTAVMAFTTIEIDFTSTGAGDVLGGASKYLVIDGSTYTYSSEAPQTYNAYFQPANYNGGQHGYQNLEVTVPVEAGNYKVTLGTCQYGNGTGAIKNAASATLETFTQYKEKACFDANKTINVVTVSFSVDAAQNILVDCGEYTPYFKMEKLADDTYTVTYSKPEGVEGNVPAAVEVAVGDNVTIPVNRTLYKEGYTLVCWTNGSNNFATGTLFTPTDNVTLTPIFAENASDFLTATSAFSVTWPFEEASGAPSMHLEGGAGNGILVAQATVGTMTVDIKLNIDATSGKFYNIGRGNNWCQLGNGTVFKFPAKAGAVADLVVMNEPTGSTLDGAGFTWDNGTATFTTTQAAGLSELTVTNASWGRSLKVTYPASEATGLNNTHAETKAVKRIVNGQLVIEKNGVRYNALGTEIK